VLQTLTALEQAAAQAGKRFKHKLDQPLIKKLEASIENATSAYNDKVSRYRTAIDKALEEINGSVRDAWRGGITEIENFYQTARNTNNFSAAQKSLRQAQQKLNHLVTGTKGDGLRKLMKSALARYKVDIGDIDTVSLRQTMQEVHARALQLEQEYDQVEQVVDQRANQIDDVDNLSTNKSPQYLQDLKRVIAGYKQVAQACANEVAPSQQLATLGAQLLQAAKQPNPNRDQIMGDALNLVRDLNDANVRMDVALARGRTGDSELPTLRKQLNITDEDDSKLIKPHWWTATMQNRKAKNNLNLAYENLEAVAELNKQHQQYNALKNAMPS